MSKCIYCGETGGRLRWLGGDDYAHTRCAGRIEVLEPGKNLWEFETANISPNPGQPIKVTSLRHLRQLEREHGVQSVAANYDQSKWSRNG